MKEFSFIYAAASQSDFVDCRCHRLVHAESVVCARNQYLKILDLEGLSPVDWSRIYVSVLSRSLSTNKGVTTL